MFDTFWKRLLWMLSIIVSQLTIYAIVIAPIVYFFGVPLLNVIVGVLAVGVFLDGVNKAFDRLRKELG